MKHQLTELELRILEGCRALAPQHVETRQQWHAAARSLAERGLLREHTHPSGASYWPSYSITPEGLRALRDSA